MTTMTTQNTQAQDQSMLAFQAKLLKKIEELTLYVIELKKENEEIKERFTRVLGE